MRKFKLIKLTQKEKDKLWGEIGPYSEANLTIQTRILDDEVSRIFIEVTVSINPYTFELIKKNRKEFKDDPMIQDLLDHAEYRGQPFGYVVCAFSEEYTDEEVKERAKLHLEYAKRIIIKMHKFVLTYLNEEVN